MCVSIDVVWRTDCCFWGHAGTAYVVAVLKSAASTDQKVEAAGIRTAEAVFLYSTLEQNRHVISL